MRMKIFLTSKFLFKIWVKFYNVNLKMDKIFIIHRYFKRIILILNLIIRILSGEVTPQLVTYVIYIPA